MSRRGSGVLERFLEQMRERDRDEDKDKVKRSLFHAIAQMSSEASCEEDMNCVCN